MAALLCLSICVTALAEGETQAPPATTPGNESLEPTPDGSNPSLEPTAKLVIAKTGSDGKTQPQAPTDANGSSIRVFLPVQCLSGTISELRITPVMSTNADAFPFKIEALDYTQTRKEALGTGEIHDFTFDFVRSPSVFNGVKQVDFIATYKHKADNDSESTSETTTLSVFVNIVNGKKEAATVNPDPGFTPTPKLIIDSYSISSDKVYAGETFKVTFDVRNTSTSEAIKNLQISVEDAGNVITPADNGSSTLYVKKINKNSTSTQSISLQTAPDTEANAYTLNIKFSYDGVSSKQAYTAESTITLPILQRIRIKCDPPINYDEPWINQPCAMYFSLYNMGKSSIYNCMVDVEGDGLAMEETYFGGNIGAGSAMRADFNIIASVAGQIDGFIVVTYEDVYGEQMEERLPISLFVNEGMGGEFPIDPSFPGVDEPAVIPGTTEPTGMPWWAWALIGLAVVAGVVVLFVILKKRRAASLEDL